MDVSIWHWPGQGSHTYVLMADDLLARRFNDPTIAVLWVARRLEKYPKAKINFKNKPRRWYYRAGD